MRLWYTVYLPYTVGFVRVPLEARHYTGGERKKRNKRFWGGVTIRIRQPRFLRDNATETLSNKSEIDPKKNADEALACPSKHTERKRG